jgi:hypothetical protein
MSNTAAARSTSSAPSALAVAVSLVLACDEEQALAREEGRVADAYAHCRGLRSALESLAEAMGADGGASDPWTRWRAEELLWASSRDCLRTAPPARPR